MRPEDKFYDIKDYSILEINPDRPEYLCSIRYDFVNSRITRLKYGELCLLRESNYSGKEDYKLSDIVNVIKSAK